MVRSKVYNPIGKLSVTEEVLPEWQELFSIVRLSFWKEYNWYNCTTDQPLY